MLFFHYKCVNSTQDLAKNYLRAGRLKKAVFATNEQLAGYGKRARRFYSPKNTGIYLSVVVPNFKVRKNIGLLTPAIAVNILLSLKAVFPVVNLKIKWVNDLYVDGKKIGGILTERLAEGLVVGVGINLNTQDFPVGLQEKAGRLTEQKVSAFEKKTLTQKIAQAVVIATECYQDPTFLNLYRHYSNVLEHQVTLQIGKKILQGKAVSIDDEARLVVEINGQRHIFNSGEITRTLIKN